MGFLQDLLLPPYRPYTLAGAETINYQRCVCVSCDGLLTCPRCLPVSLPVTHSGPAWEETDQISIHASHVGGFSVLQTPFTSCSCKNNRSTRRLCHSRTSLQQIVLLPTQTQDIVWKPYMRYCQEMYKRFGRPTYQTMICLGAS